MPTMIPGVMYNPTVSSERTFVPLVPLVTIKPFPKLLSRIPLISWLHLAHLPVSNHWHREWDHSGLEGSYLLQLPAGGWALVQNWDCQNGGANKGFWAGINKLQQGEMKCWEPVRNQTFSALEELGLRLGFSTISDLADPFYYNMGTFVTSITPSILKWNSYITHLSIQFQKRSVQCLYRNGEEKWNQFVIKYINAQILLH